MMRSAMRAVATAGLVGLTVLLVGCLPSADETLGTAPGGAGGGGAAPPTSVTYDFESGTVPTEIVFIVSNFTVVGGGILTGTNSLESTFLTSGFPPDTGCVEVTSPIAGSRLMFDYTTDDIGGNTSYSVTLNAAAQATPADADFMTQLQYNQLMTIAASDVITICFQEIGGFGVTAWVDQIYIGP